MRRERPAGESVVRQPRSEVVDGEAELLVAGKQELQLWGDMLSFQCRLDYVFDQYNGSLLPLWTGLQ